MITEALIAGAKLLAGKAAEEFAKSGGKTAFEALKTRLTRDKPLPVLELVERVEDIDSLRPAIESELATVPTDAEISALAQRLAEAIAAMPQETLAAYAIDGGKFRSGEAGMTFEDVEGMKGVDAATKGAMTVKGVRSPGK